MCDKMVNLTKEELRKVVEQIEKLADKQNEYVEEGEKNKDKEQSAYYQGKQNGFYNVAEG